MLELQGAIPQQPTTARGWDHGPILLTTFLIQILGPAILTLIPVARILVEARLEDWYVSYGPRQGHNRVKTNKQAEKVKKNYPGDRQDHSTTRQTVEWLFSSPKVPVCHPWGRTNFATRISSLWIAERLHDNDFDRRKLQNLEDKWPMQTGDGIEQRVDRRLVRQVPTYFAQWPFRTNIGQL
uniref:Uncharacterized protein n=1 Tax=Solanum tuberosum TaxID=4113 RepID=M1DKS4_SOLTU